MLLAALAGGIGLVHPSSRALWPSSAIAIAGTALLLALHAWLCLRAWRVSGERVRLEHDGQHWRVTREPDTPAERIHDRCTLQRGAYRDAWLLLLHFVDRDGRRLDVEIHRDAVPAEVFSALHLTCRFADPERPPLGASRTTTRARPPVRAADGSLESPFGPALHSPPRPHRVESP